MRWVNIATSAGKKIWEKYLNRSTGYADPQLVRKDPLTRAVFKKPVSAREAVKIILSEIQSQGDKAVIRYTRSLEKYNATPKKIEVSKKEIRAAVQQVPRQLQSALKQATANIRAFHVAQRAEKQAQVIRPGVVVRERRQPLDRVGIYVPGGVAPLVSTVLMNALPARVAGVKEIIMATPPQADGSVLPAILYAAQLAGVDRIFRLGGATAIGALAFGTKTVPKVDKIAGPANVFGTEAKRQVVGHVGIDSLAGPSEILIIADDSADPIVLAWDLLAQCEHGSGAVSILLSDSDALIEKVIASAKTLSQKHPELLAAFSIAIAMKTKNLAQAVAMANAYAPEHLSIQTKKPKTILAHIHRAGAVFIGKQTAQAMGDYIAGPNHVLPTNQTAYWSSPLSVRDFERYTSVVEYSEAGMKREGRAAIAIADAEGLRAHAGSIRARIGI